MRLAGFTETGSSGRGPASSVHPHKHDASPVLMQMDTQGTTVTGRIGTIIGVHSQYVLQLAKATTATQPQRGMS